MRNARGKFFATICGASLILAIAIAITWIKSFQSEYELFSFYNAGTKYSVVSKWGQFVVMLFPLQREANPIVQNVIGKMSNRDFDWYRLHVTHSTTRLVIGDVRRNSPTWEMYHQFVARQNEGKPLDQGLLNWMEKAIDDPDCFASAYLMMQLATGDTREKQLQNSENQSDVIIEGETPGVILPADASMLVPAFSQRPDLRRQWRELWSVQQAALFHGWIFLCAMVLPIAWLARPRFRETSWKSWAGNALALLLGVACLSAMCMWVRSHWITEQWMFERRGAHSNKSVYKYPWLGSTKGALKMVELQGPFLYLHPLGYARTGDFETLGRRVPNQPGERYFKILGIELYVQPVQEPTIAPWRVWSLSIGWWLIAGLSAIWPLSWGWRACALWKRGRRTAICKVCGYDMRATTQRCPECGTEPIVPDGEE